MRIAFSSDHAGFDLKRILLDYVRELGHDVQDLGAYDTTPSDYPDAAERVGLALRDQQAERGVLICGSGVGASVAANKVAGIRAGLCHDSYSAHQGVEHDNMNVLVLGSRVIGVETAKDLVQRFLGAQFSGEERHVRRLNKVNALESRY
jgi:ribose 5-phosphate isomerase B